MLGDSHLAAFNVGRIAELEAALDGRVVVHNHAIGGANSSHLVERASLEAATHRALFVVSVGTNDLAPWKRIPPTEFAANTTRLLDQLGGIRSIVVLPPTVDEASQRLSRGEHGRTNSLVVEYGETLATVSRHAGAVIVDLVPLLVDNGEVHEADGVHLNADGKTLLVRAISAGVSQLLADQRTR